MRRLLFHTVIVLAMLIPTAYTFSQTKASLSGMVTDSSKKPLSFATVRIFKQNSITPLQTTLSNESGAFHFNNPGEGNYTLTLTHTGFAENKQNITVKPGGDMQIAPMELSPITGTLKEVVVKSQRPLVEQA